MIQASPSPLHTESWREQLAGAIRDPRELLRELNLPENLLPGALAASESFSLRVPRAYLARIEKGNPCDPLLRQVLPLDEESRDIPGFGADPVGDLAAMAVPGLLHKYHGRALLVSTGACAIHCRYCFRRHFPYGEGGAHGQAEVVLDYLREHPEIEEIILSGGDPLSLADPRLEAWLDALRDAPRIRRLRLHTRLPIAIPDRVTPGLLALLRGFPRPVVMVVHCNHAREIDTGVATALARLHAAGVTLYNQAVLLRGVNDDAASLAELSERLFDNRVQPYYLHLLDPVRGAAHFTVETGRAAELMRELRARLPGYLVPLAVSEHAGGEAKRPLNIEPGGG